MGKECAMIILLYKAVNNEDEHNNDDKVAQWNNAIEYRELFNGYGPIRFHNNIYPLILLLLLLLLELL